jgi:hypothetical protein
MAVTRTRGALNEGDVIRISAGGQRSQSISPARAV